MDFYGNTRKIRLYLDICRGLPLTLSEYDLETAAEFIENGYAVKTDDTLKTAAVVYTEKQCNAVHKMAQDFLRETTVDTIRSIFRLTSDILCTHTPKHLQAQIPAITAMDSFVHTVCIPAELLIEKNVITTDYHPCELPTTYAVIG